MGYEQMNLRVAPEIMDRIKKSGIRYARLVEIGLEFLEKRTNLEAELLDLRAGNAKLQSIVQSQGRRIVQLENPEFYEKNGETTERKTDL